MLLNCLFWSGLALQARPANPGGLLAFQIPGKAEPVAARVAARLAAAGAIDLSGPRSEYGVRVFEARTPQALHAAKSALDSACLSRLGCVVLPVLQRGESYDVPINRIVVRFSDDVSPDRAEAVFRKFRLSPIPHLRIASLNYYVVENKGIAATAMEALARRLGAMPGVIRARAEYQSYSPASP